MSMVKKSITITDQQNNWIKAQIEIGHYGNESEVVRELIREKQEIEAIRAKLIDAEKSGFTDQTVDQIWEEARHQDKASHA